MVLVVVRQGGWTVWKEAKDDKSQKMTLGRQGTFLKMGCVEAQRVNLLFLKGCWRGEMMTMMMLLMRWEPLCRHLTVWQQHWVLKNLPPDSVFIVLPSYQQWVVWGAGNRQSTQYLLTVSTGFSASNQTSIRQNRVFNYYSYFVTGEDE
jgi:hypothetical protein